MVQSVSEFEFNMRFKMLSNKKYFQSLLINVQVEGGVYSIQTHGNKFQMGLIWSYRAVNSGQS